MYESLGDGREHKAEVDDKTGLDRMLSQRRRIAVENGAELMKRIAMPMLGGMISATLLTLIVVPALHWLRQGRNLTNTE